MTALVLYSESLDALAKDWIGQFFCRHKWRGTGINSQDEKQMRCARCGRTRWWAK